MDKFNGMYFTICYAVYNSKSKKLKYASAGHPPMVLISGNKVNSLESQNIFIGAVVNSEYSSDEIIINPNDTLFLFSDGVFEFEKSSQEMYTFDNFKRDLNKGICLEKNGLEKLYENAKNICSRKELEDDFSIVKIQFLK
jgi:sigma-B regulation protein RsbU (phosphoserine phosphatase)